MTWRNLLNRLKGEPANHRGDLDDELTFHREMRERELMAEGYSANEARQAAGRDLGNLAVTREDARGAWRFTWLDDLARDIRYGFRTLSTQPGFVIAAFLALTLGIGINSVFFSIYNAMALAPWAVRDARNTVQLYNVITQSGPDQGRPRGFSWPESRYLQQYDTSFDGIVAHDSMSFRVRHGANSWNANAMAVSENFFNVLGTGFTLGRGFSPADGDGSVPHSEVILHYDTWLARFAGDRSIIGQRVDINGHSLQVVGVASPGFSGPSVNKPQFWLPAGWRDLVHPGSNSYLNTDSCCARLTARLKPGITRGQASAEMDNLLARFGSQFHTPAHRALITDATFLADPSMKRKALPAFIPIFLASGLILLLACANVANLHLARAGTRRREIAVRLSLGAGKTRILRQLLAESLLLSTLAGIASVAISQYAPAALMRLMLPAGESVSFTFRNDWRVVAFILGMTFAATTLFGLGPALRAVGDGAAAGMKDGGRSTRSGRLRTILLAAQVALCAVLVSGAALLTRALDKAQQVETGFRSERVLRLSLDFDTIGMDATSTSRVLRSVTERISALPGVTNVAHTSVVPLSNSFEGTRIRDPHNGSTIPTAWVQVSASYFSTLEIGLLTGSAFKPTDEGRSDIVAVSESLAKRLWPGENAVGKTVDGLPGGAPRKVTAIVKDTAFQHLGGEPEPAVYVPSTGTGISSILVAYEGSPDPLLAALPRLARDIDPRLLPSAELYAASVARSRSSAIFAATVAGCLGVLALVLACVGVYGVAACDVAQRTREIGIRVALGARATRVVRMVLGRNLGAAAAGVALGISGSLGLGKVLHALLYGVSPADPWALATTIGILVATAALATWGPARRAVRVQPSIALRHE